MEVAAVGLMSLLVIAVMTLQGCGNGSSNHSPSPPPSPGAKLACPGKTTALDVVGGHNLTGKTAIVDGGDSGIGFAISFALAKQGASVIIAAHNLTRAKGKSDTISMATGSHVRAYEVDLDSFASVRSFVQSYDTDVGTGVHFLINDAGVSKDPNKVSSDGFPVLIEIDYLGHFLLTELLLPYLRKAEGARVISVSSDLHEHACEFAGWSMDCFKDWKYLGPEGPPVVPKKNVTVHTPAGTMNLPGSAYGVAKWLQIQHMAELAVREAQHGIQAFSVAPGFTNTTQFSHIRPDNPNLKVRCKPQVHPYVSIPENPCPFTPEQGAAVVAFCAVDNITSGRYYTRTFACEERPVVMHGFTEKMQPELYAKSLQWVGRRADQERHGDFIW